MTSTDIFIANHITSLVNQQLLSIDQSNCLQGNFQLTKLSLDSPSQDSNDPDDLFQSRNGIIDLRPDGKD